MHRGKGVSPLISAVLLIAFTLTVATLIFNFLTSTVRTTTATVENKTSEAIDCSAASINVEDVIVSGTTPATVRVIVKNSGFSNGLTVSNVEVFNRTGNNFTAFGLPILNFDRGEIATVTVNASFASCPASFLKVLVTTTCGGVSDEFDGTPKCS